MGRQIVRIAASVFLVLIHVCRTPQMRNFMAALQVEATKRASEQAAEKEKKAKRAAEKAAAKQ